MRKDKIFLKKLLSNIPFLNKFIRKIYNKNKYGAIFIPIDFKFSNDQILKNKTYKLNLENFNALKKQFNFFLISNKKSILNYPKDKLEKLINLIKNNKAEVAYDGNDYYHTEIASSNILEYYSKKYLLENYPYRFFYIKRNFDVKNIGSQHRSYNFNGTFRLPSGGRTIGDGGDVTVRLNFIPNLTGKTFLDIGSEEGYAVF